MSIRMPNSIQTRQMLLGLQRTQDRLALNSLRVSSGNRITSPGDDPAGAAAVLDLGTSIQANTQFQKQADSAIAFLKSAEDVVSSSVDSIMRLQELAQQGLGTTTASGRAAIAPEVAGIRTDLIALANTKVQGKYLFSGTRTQTQPFTPPASGATPYNGNSALINLDVSVGTTVATNLTGDKLYYTTDGSTPPATIDLFQVVADLRDGLSNNNTTQIQAASDNLQRFLGTFTQAQTDLGGRQAGLQALQNMLSGFNLSLQSQQNDLQDTNYPDTLMQVSNDTTVQSATLSTMAKTNQQSLFNYLG